MQNRSIMYWTLKFLFLQLLYFSSRLTLPLSRFITHKLPNFPIGNDTTILIFMLTNRRPSYCLKKAWQLSSVFESKDIPRVESACTANSRDYFSSGGPQWNMASTNSPLFRPFYLNRMIFPDSSNVDCIIGRGTRPGMQSPVISHTALWSPGGDSIDRGNVFTAPSRVWCTRCDSR